MHTFVILRPVIFCGFQNVFCGFRIVGSRSSDLSLYQLHIGKISSSEARKELKQTFNVEKKSIIF